jgi:uncharacterized repeat protein (TIGR03803 family)
MNCTRRDGNLYGTGRGRGANGTGRVFKITPVGVETLASSFPSTWINCATKGGCVSSSTSFTVN